MHYLYPFAKRFIAGNDRTTAIKNIHSLIQSGYGATIDVLGENVQTAEQASRARQEYLDLIGDLSALNQSFDLSIKLSQMGLGISRETCQTNIENILSHTGSHTLRFDMEGSDTTHETIDLCYSLHPNHKNLGLVLQAYLHRTDQDIPKVIEKGISTRLCKGAYKEPPDIAMQDMGDIRNNFLKQAKRLLKQGFLPAIATHDEWLLREILKFIDAEKISPDSFYFEMLYGVRRDLQKVLLDRGFRVRVYVPYGEAWLPYTLRRLAERKENLLFVARNLFRETFGLGNLN